MRVSFDLESLALVGLTAFVVVRDLQTRQALRTLTMTTKADFDDLRDRINTATNTLAARLSALEEQITNAGLPADVEAAVHAEFLALTTALESLGADPNNPVPEIPPVEPPLPPIE